MCKFLSKDRCSQICAAKLPAGFTNKAGIRASTRKLIDHTITSIPCMVYQNIAWPGTAT